MPRGVAKTVEAIEEMPAREAVMTMNALGYLFIATALAAGIAWIVYIVRAVRKDMLGDKTNGAVYLDNSGSTVNTSAQGNTNLNTARTCFQAAVVSVLFYFVARHHFSHLHM